MEPDPWQRDLLRSRARRVLVLTGRQNGKSTAGAAKCLSVALGSPGRTVLITSPSFRQSVEVYRKAVALFDRMGRPVPAKVNATYTQFGNGSRLIALPGDERTIRGFSDPALVLVDEAARVPDSLLTAVTPMLTVSGGTLIGMTTPFGMRGWFYREWQAGAWQNVRVTSADCPRITPAFLAEERRSLGELWFAQEHGAAFNSDVNAVFSPADVLAAVSGDVKPLFPIAA